MTHVVAVVVLGVRCDPLWEHEEHKGGTKCTKEEPQNVVPFVVLGVLCDPFFAFVYGNTKNTKKAKNTKWNRKTLCPLWFLVFFVILLCLCFWEHEEHKELEKPY